MFGFGKRKEKDNQWKDYLSSAEKALKDGTNKKDLEQLFNHKDGYSVPENIEKEIDNVRGLIAERLLEFLELKNDTLVIIALRPNGEMAEIATKRLLDSDAPYKHLVRVFIRADISYVLKRKIFNKIAKNPKEISGWDFCGLLANENLCNFWNDIESLLFSPQTPTEQLFRAYESINLNNFQPEQKNKLRNKLKQIMIQRGLSLHIKFEERRRCYVPIYRDSNSEEFEQRWPLSDKWVEKKLKEISFCSKEKLFEEMEDPNIGMYNDVCTD